MLDLALHAGEGTMRLADIAERQGISLSYLEQLFAALDQSIEYLPRWEDCVRGATERSFNFTDRPIKTINEVKDGLRQTALDMGALLQY